MKIKKLDKYLVKQFLFTFLFALMAFILIFVIIDLMEHLDDFIDHSATVKIVLIYYLVFIPEIIRLMIPVAVLLASLFVTGRLASHNEITAIKSSGISLYRYLVPFLVTAFFISLIAVYFGGFAVPLANKKKLYIEQKYLGKRLNSSGVNIFFQDAPDRIVTIAYYDVNTGIANNVGIQEFNPDNLTELKERIDAMRMFYDSNQKAWVLTNGVKRIFRNDSIQYYSFGKLTVKNLNFKPKEILEKQKTPQELTLPELKRYAAERIRTGNDPTRIEIEYHSRIAFAFAGLIVVLLGVPVSINKRTGSLAIQFGISLVVTFLYLVFMKIFQAMGKNGIFNPFLTAWSANILFFIAAMVNLIKASK